MTLSGTYPWTSPFQAAELRADVMVARNILSREDCAKIISTIEARPEQWQKSSTVADANAGSIAPNSPRKSDGFPLSSIAGKSLFTSINKVDDLCFGVFGQAVQAYSRLLGERFAIDQDEGYSVLRYGQGGEYKYHVDNGAASTGTLRTLSALLYLNDNYVGGEIDFPRQALKIKPETGLVIVFPAIANFIHASLPIESGIKYTVVTWFR